MRIAFFCTRFPCVSETFVLSQLAGLLDQGFEIDVHAIQPGDGDVLQPIFRKYGLERHISYRGRTGSVIGRILATLWLILCLGVVSPLKLLALARLVRTVPEINFVAALFTLKGLKSRPKADLLYAHFGPNGQVAATLKAVGLIDLPIVTVFHGFDVTLVIEEWGPRYYRVLFEHGDLMLPVSKEFKRRLVTLGCPAAKIVVHHMGVDIQTLTFKERKDPKPGCPIKILAIARLVEKKGIADGISAVANIAAMGKHAIVFDIVGDGVLREELDAFIKKTECSNLVTLVGWKDQDAVQEFIESADIYLAPSVTAANGDEEGIPVVLMEAAATGLPLVSTRHSGIPELVRDQETGLLANEHDVPGLTSALEQLCADGELRRQLGRNGRNLVAREFAIDSLNTKLGKLLQGQVLS